MSAMIRDLYLAVFVGLHGRYECFGSALADLDLHAIFVDHRSLERQQHSPTLAASPIDSIPHLLGSHLLLQNIQSHHKLHPELDELARPSSFPDLPQQMAHCCPSERHRLQDFAGDQFHTCYSGRSQNARCLEGSVSFASSDGPRSS